MLHIVEEGEHEQQVRENSIISEFLCEEHKESKDGLNFCKNLPDKLHGLLLLTLVDFSVEHVEHIERNRRHCRRRLCYPPAQVRIVASQSTNSQQLRHVA